MSFELLPWLLHAVPVEELLVEAGPGVDAGVGRLAEGEHLPQDDPEGPDVGLRGEDPVPQGLDGHPLDREARLPDGKI